MKTGVKAMERAVGGQAGEEGGGLENWLELKRRLKKVQEALEGNLEPAPGVKREILRERAQVLAREPAGGVPAGECFDVVAFTLAGERYAVDLAHVREVCPIKSITPLPGTPLFVLGIMNVRGQILSVIDLKNLFKLPGGSPGDRSKVIIVRNSEMEIGIFADVVSGIETISFGEVQAVPPSLSGIQADFMKGVTENGVAVLDAAIILSDRRILVHDEVE